MTQRQSEPPSAFDAALHYLSGRSRTGHEMERYLLKKGYGPDAVREALEKCARYGYVDDLRYARQFAAERLGGRRASGPQRIREDLRRRGVAPEVIAAALDEKLPAVDQVELAVQAAAPRLKSAAGLDRQQARRRLAAFLARRGFDWETIGAALERLL